MIPMADEETTLRTLAIKRDDMPATIPATTPGLLPNIVVQAVSPIVAILIRAIRVLLQVTLALLAAKGVGLAGDTLPAREFWHLLHDCMGLGVAAAVFSALQNTVELLAKLDQKFPIFRG